MSGVATASDGELAARSDRLAELLDLKERLADGSLERELNEVTREQLLREQQTKTERQNAIRDFERAATEYERARGETFEAIRGYVDAVERANRLWQAVGEERRRCKGLGGISSDDLNDPEPTQVLVPRNREWHELFKRLQWANAAGF